MKEQLPKGLRLAAAIGLLGVSCTVDNPTPPAPQKSSSQMQERQVSQHSIDIGDYIIITRINSDRFMISDHSDRGNSYGGIRTRNLYKSIDYLRDHDCLIENVENLADLMIRVDLVPGTGEQCLPDLK